MLMMAVFAGRLSVMTVPPKTGYKNPATQATIIVLSKEFILILNLIIQFTEDGRRKRKCIIHDRSHLEKILLFFLICEMRNST
jgi:hypothetical protein